MVEPNTATIIICVFLLIFGVALPIVDGLTSTSRFVSLRWFVVVVLLALAIGATIDFSHLTDETRQIVILGALIVGGGFVVLRTVEKIIANGWHWGGKVVASKGDAKLEITGSDRKDEDVVQ